MKVLGIVGSPRKEGNTDILVSKTMEGIGNIEQEKIYLTDFSLQPCKACFKCKETGVCVIQDDFQLLLQKIMDSDFIVFGSPVYCMTVTSLSKVLIERVNSSQTIMTTDKGRTKFRSRIEPSGKKGIIICIGDLSSLDTIQAASKVMGWLFIASGIELVDRILARSISKRRDALKDASLLQQAFNAGIKLRGCVC